MAELNTLGGVIKTAYEGEADTNALTDAEKSTIANLGTASPLDVPASGDAAAGEVVKGDDTRLSDARAPTAHNQLASTITDFDSAADARVAAASVGDLSDVTIPGITDGQLLAWSTANSQFEAVDPAAGGGSVDSVNGSTGTVVLGADDIDDAATTNKFVSQAEIDKLAAIEAAADVTDTANVTAAGAFMESEVTNLADVKSFDPAAYATAAQGNTADSALQPGANVSGLTNDAQFVPSDPTGITGADQITNMVSLTQAEYDAIGTPDASTFYVITG